MPANAETDFVDLIYDTAFDPSLWPTVMVRLADMIGGSGGWISQLSCVDGSGGASSDPCSRLDPAWLARYAEEFAAINPIALDDNPQAYLDTWRPITRAVEAEIPREVLRKTEFYHGFLAPQDISSSLLVRLARRGEETATLNLNCTHRKDQFSADEITLVERYQPDMVRAFQLGSRLAEARQFDPGPDGLFDSSHHGLFLVDRQGTVRRMNPVAQALVREQDALMVRNGMLASASLAARAPLQALIASACNRQHPTGGSVSIATETRWHPVSVCVVPVSAERASPFHIEPAALVCATDLNGRAELPGAQLRRIFGLTEAESRVAVAIFQGRSPAEVSESLGVAIQTVRNHLARIFDKTDTRRQAELSSLLMRLIGAPGV